MGVWVVYYIYAGVLADCICVCVLGLGVGGWGGWVGGWVVRWWGWCVCVCGGGGVSTGLSSLSTYCPEERYTSVHSLSHYICHKFDYLIPLRSRRPDHIFSSMWCHDIRTVRESDYASFIPGKYTGTVYPKKYAHGFVVLCFVVVMLSSIINSNEVFIHIHQGCFAGTGAIVRLPQCQ